MRNVTELQAAFMAKRDRNISPLEFNRFRELRDRIVSNNNALDVCDCPEYPEFRNIVGKIKAKFPTVIFAFGA